MSFKFFKTNKILIAILVFAAFLHFFRLDYPNAYVFDEVYHAFTAKEYLKGSKETWEWWTTPPPGVAFEWTHPPLAKEMMTASMFLTRSTDAWSWRLPGAFLGIISVFLVYKLGEKLFGRNTGLISGFIFSLDGLNFVQSRTGMNDIYLVTFSLASMLFLLNRNFFVSAVFLGLSFASKWSALYLFGFNSLIIIHFFLSKKIKAKEVFRSFFYMVIFTVSVYFISYLPFFLLGHSFDQFIELQRQMFWYHSHLVATHDYSSPAWSWPLNLYPVWYYVQYHDNGLISNIFASGNPILFWLGVGGILITLYDLLLILLKKTNPHLKDSYIIVLLGFFIFWLPWIFSPRIMFLYHFSPSVPFLSLCLGHQINLITQEKKSRFLGITVLLLILLGFILVYPILTGLPMQKEIFVKFFDTNLSKNPFGQ